MRGEKKGASCDRFFFVFFFFFFFFFFLSEFKFEAKTDYSLIKSKQKYF